MHPSDPLVTQRQAWLERHSRRLLDRFERAFGKLPCPARLAANPDVDAWFRVFPQRELPADVIEGRYGDSLVQLTDEGFRYFLPSLLRAALEDRPPRYLEELVRVELAHPPSARYSGWSREQLLAVRDLVHAAVDWGWIEAECSRAECDAKPSDGAAQVPSYVEIAAAWDRRIAT